MSTIPHEAGKSSFDLIDEKLFLDALPREGVSTILDVGCGTGNYSLAMAREFPGDVVIKGVDLWAAGVAALSGRARERGFPNIEAFTANASDLSSVGDGTVDLLLMATIVHDLAERGEEAAALKECARVLRRGGTLAVVEFNKADIKPGPPFAIRLSAEDLSAMVAPMGFGGGVATGLGVHCYLALFTRT